MSFQSDAFKLKSKLHISEVKPSVLIGICLLALALFFFILQGALTIFSPQSYEVVKQEPEASASNLDASGSESSAQDEMIFIHVAGAVTNPGVVEVSEGARLFDVVEAAGGFTADAASEAINLARKAVDGEQISVLTHDEYEQSTQNNSVPEQASSANVSGLSTGKININTATQTELESLSGIGSVTAQRILAYREANGTFKTPEDIKNVSGIGEKKYESIAEMICV